MGIGIGMLGLWTDHKRKSQLLEQMHQERMAAIEKGIELPPMNADLLHEQRTPEQRRPTRRASLRNGVFMLSFGIVLYFALDTVGASEARRVRADPGRPSGSRTWPMRRCCSTRSARRKR